MKKLVVLLTLSCTLVACHERYRYPCQDPDNFDKKECLHPICDIDGMCPENLVGHKIFPENNQNGSNDEHKQLEDK